MNQLRFKKKPPQTDRVTNLEKKTKQTVICEKIIRQLDLEREN